MEQLQQHIEALVFAAPQPIPFGEIRAVLNEVFQTETDEADIRASLENSMGKYRAAEFPFEIVEIAGGFQFMTKGAFHPSVAVHLKQTTKKRLSQAALETLAIVAYKQPVSKSELEQIRGVDCNYAVQKLLEKELVAITGRSEGPGRPLLYGTSDKFMDYLGIKSLADLPKPKDFKEVESEVGSPETADA